MHLEPVRLTYISWSIDFVNFYAKVIAASVKPCIVNVLHIPFQNRPEPGALDLFFMFLVILSDAGAISTSAAFLF